MSQIKEAKTIVDVLRARAKTQPDALAYAFIEDGDVVASYSYSQLDRRCRTIAEALSQHPIGARALLLYPPGIEYVAAFYGCLYAGIIAVPAYPPDPTRLARSVRRLQAIAKDAGAELLLTTQINHTAQIPHIFV